MPSVAPRAAEDYLRSNPALWPQFKQKYGYTPGWFTPPRAPAAAEQHLAQNPDLAPQFEEKYGYLPKPAAPPAVAADAEPVAPTAQDQPYEEMPFTGANANGDTGGVVGNTANLVKRSAAGIVEGVAQLPKVLGTVAENATTSLMGNSPEVRAGAGFVTDLMASPTAGIADWAKKKKDEAVAALDPKARRALELSLVERDEEDHLKIGAGAKDPWWWTANVIDVGMQALPGMAVTAASARMAYAARYQQVLTELAGQKIPQSVALKTAEAEALKAAEHSAVIAGGLTEGVAAAGQDSAQTRDAINSLDEQTLMNYPGYVELRDKGLTHEQAREKIASDKAAAVAIAAGAVVGLTGAPMNAWFGKLAAKYGRQTEAKVATSAGARLLARAKTAGEGIAGEGAQEFVQEGSEQYIQNTAEGPVTGAKPWDSVLENAITGAVLGGVVGGGVGVLGHSNPKQAKPTEEAPKSPPPSGEEPAPLPVERAAIAYENATEALHNAERDARDPNVSMDYATLQAAREARQQAMIDYTRELLHAGAIKPKDQAKVADALKQAGAKGMEAAPGKPAGGDVSPERDAALEAVASGTELDDAGAHDLVAKGLAKVNPRGVLMLTPEGRRQRKAAQERAKVDDTVAKQAAKPNEPKGPPPSGQKQLDIEKVKEGGPTAPRRKLTLPAERREIAMQREAQRAERALKPKKDLARERADVAVTPENVARRAVELQATENEQAKFGAKTTNPQMRDAFVAAADNARRARAGLPVKAGKSVAMSVKEPKWDVIQVDVPTEEQAQKNIASMQQLRRGHSPWSDHEFKVQRAPVEASGFQERGFQILARKKPKTVAFSLKGAPAEANIPGHGKVKIESVPVAKEAAAAYRKAKGITTPEHTEFARVDVPRAKRIAKAFEEMKHEPNNPVVKRAYRAMIDETKAQWDQIKKTGLKVEFIKPGQPDPYAASPRMAIEDVRKNNHLWVFPTDSGFGTDSKYSKDNPMLEDAGETIGGHKLKNNDVFRIVHDYFGHVAEANGFRADGEENAWRIHAGMYSPLARRAMTTETRGQNSWVNYGPHGEKNRTAKAGETVYADQKIGLLPAEFSAFPNGKTLKFKHFSPATDDRIDLDPERMGTGVKGAEAKRGGPKVVSLYAEHGETEPDVANGRNRYNVEIPEADLYNLSEDPQGLLAQAQVPVGITQNDKGEMVPVSHRFDMNKLEELVRDAGYLGYHTPGAQGVLKGQARIFHKYPATREGAQQRKVNIAASMRKTRATSEERVRGFLTPEENARLKKASAKKLIEVFDELPDGTELAASAVAGQAKRGWYRRSAEALANVFGPDAPRFAALLAAMSPQTSVEWNFRNAIAVWAGWEKTGRPTDTKKIKFVMRDNVFPNSNRVGKAKVLPAWVNNTVRALQAEDPSSVMLSGPKVDSFAANLRGETERVTLDAWMANWAGVNQNLFKGQMNEAGTNPGMRPGYLAYAARVRQAAEILSKRTGETWTPAEVQETVWSWAKTLYEQAESFGALATARELVDNQEITDELINATPDFAGLFSDPEVSASLRGTVYGPRAARSAGEAAAKRGPAGKAAPALEQDRRHLRRAADRLDALREARKAAEDETREANAASVNPQTETQSFKNWFGDSKVVDENGQPLVVYHGTGAKIVAFEARPGRNSTVFGGEDVQRAGWFFTPDEDAAHEYAGKDGNEDPQVGAYFLSIQKPVSFLPTTPYAEQMTDTQFRSIGINPQWHALGTWEMFDGDDGAAFVRGLRELGYDGAVFRESDRFGRGFTTYVAFDPTQIKSAIGNRGTFDPNNPDVTASTGAGRGLSRTETEAVVTRMRDELGVNVQIADTVADLPPYIQEHLAPGMQPNGFFVEDEINGDHEMWLIRENLDDERNAYETALHEVVGHRGLRGVLGDNYHKVMEQIRNSFPDQVIAAARRNKIDLFHPDPATRRRLHSLATEEMIAYATGRILSERGALSQQSVWRRIIAKVRDILRSVGVLNNWSTEDIEALIYRARDFFNTPAQARASQLVYAQKVAAAAERGKPGPVWHSAVEQFIDLAKQGSATPQQWWGMIKNAKGVKPEELEWLGLEDWLKEESAGKVMFTKERGQVRLPPEKITRQDLLSYVRANKLQVQDVEKGGPDAVTLNLKSPYYTPQVKRVIKEAGGPSATRHRMELQLKNDGDAYRELMDSFPNLRDREDWEEVVLNDLRKVKDVAATKYAQYQTPGGENYRELLLTMPSRRDYVAFADYVDSEGYTFEDGQITDAAQDEIERMEREFEAANPGRLFRSGHWSEPNILVHVRFNERTVDGKKVLFLEEVQSDWHQQGRRVGYTVAKASRERLNALIGASNERELTAAERAELDAAHDDNRQNRVPDAPFKTTWHELAMKRMIRYAAEHGFDKIAWTTGAMQADRYDLSKQIDTIAVAPKQNGTRTVRIEMHGDSVGFAVNKDAVVSNANGRSELEGKKLDEVIGKEMADKVMAAEGGTHVFRGDDLKIGGEGMKGFYDKLLPKTVDKYVKKWGAKVEPINLPAERRYTIEGYSGHWEVRDIAEGGTLGQIFGSQSQARKWIDMQPKTGAQVHSLTITPAMRDSVLESQPMFSMKRAKKRRTELTDYDDMVDSMAMLQNAGMDDKGVDFDVPKDYVVDAEREMRDVEDDFEESRRLQDFEPPESGSYFSRKKPVAGPVTPDVVFPPDFDTVIRGKDPYRGYLDVDAYANGERVGYVSMSEDRVDEDGWSAEYVYVKPEYRGKGIAQQMYKAISDKLGVKPRPSTAQTGLGRRMWESFDRRDVAFSFRVPPTGDPDLDSMIKKIGQKPKSLRQRWNELRAGLGQRLIVETLDPGYGVLANERDLGVLSKDSGYKSWRLHKKAGDLVAGIMRWGAPKWFEGAPIISGSRGFLDIVKPLGNNLNLWATAMVARRAERLMAEGREHLLTKAEIAAGMRLWQQHPEFHPVAVEYAKLQKSILDFAQEAGVVNPATRPIWENQDYIPFYRIMDSGEPSKTMRAGKGVGFVRRQINQLKGGENNIGDPIENIVRNWSMLMDASLKAHAGRRIVDNFDGTGLVVKVGTPPPPGTTPTTALDQALKDIGVDPTKLTPAARARFEQLFSYSPPTGDDIVSVWRNGQKEQWRVVDPLILPAFEEMNDTGLAAIKALLSFPKRVVTAGITMVPSFVVANALRDPVHSFVMGTKVNGKRIASGAHRSIIGAGKILASSPSAKAVISGGGAFISGQMDTSDAASAARTVRRTMKRRRLTGLQRVINTPYKLWSLYRDLQTASENASRVARYEASRKAGLTHMESAYESLNLMDFTLQGRNQFLRLLLWSVPFLNARLQGMYRVGESFKSDPVGTMFRGALVALFTLAMAARYKDDDRYKELSDADKQNYWHAWDVIQPGDHIQIPKPFETGVIFSTPVETALDYAMTNADQPDRAKQALDYLGFSLEQQLNLSPEPQLVWPMLELAMNRDTFTKAPILNGTDLGLPPEDQFNPTTSPTYKLLAQNMPSFMPEAMRSPKQLEHLAEGYLGTVSDYVTAATDVLADQAAANVPRPATGPNVVGLSRFYKTGPARHTKYEGEMYRLATEAAKLQNAIKKNEDLDSEEGDKRIEQIESENEPLLDVAEDIKSAAGEVSQLKKQQRDIRLDPNMSPADKRAELDALQEEINEAAKDAYDLRPGGKLNPETAAELLVAPPTARATILRKNNMPATADLLEQFG